MERTFILKEANLTMINNRGYTLLSILLVLMMLSSFVVLTLNNFKDFDDSHLVFINNYLSNQTTCLTNRSENIIEGSNNHFNKNGHVAKAETIEIGNHKVIIHLGNGYITYE